LITKLKSVARANSHTRAASEKYVSRQVLDDAPIRRFCDRRRIERALQISFVGGTTGLSVAFDLPTQIGLDSDDELAAGEVGKVGVAIDSLEDMLRLFDEIPLDTVSTSMTINATASTLLCLYLAVAKKQNVSFDKVQGTIQNDILKEYIARGTYIYPPKPSLRLITDTFAFCAAEVPNWNTISISGYHIREAGSTAAQEIALLWPTASRMLTQRFRSV
jgi:methylmalonyl-CoA mutase cobalamin-binding domain/chain